MLTRRPSGRPDPDAGMTMVELVVGMTLMVIVGVIGLRLFVPLSNAANTTTEQSLVGASARSAVNTMAAALRVADTSGAVGGAATGRFVTINPTEVKFFTDVSAANRSGSAVRSAPTEVDFQLLNGALWEYTYAPMSSTAPASYPSAPTTKTALTTKNVTVTALAFTYCSDATDSSTSCTTTTNPASVAFVQVSITVRGATEYKGAAQQTVRTGIAITGAVS